MHAQFDPPKVKPPDEATIKLITDRLVTLRNAVGKAVKVKPDVAPDLDIYVKAITWIVHHNEWLVNDAGKQTLAVIEQGIKRAEAVQAGQTPWLEQSGKTHVRAYRSAIDGSVQPYAVWLPADYGKDPKKIYRVDIMLHGRDSTLTEVKFLNGHNGRDTPTGQDFVQIDIYGRGNNAYRWAGEGDVFEAFDDFKQREAQRYGRSMVDDQRVVLKGFSMGGGRNLAHRLTPSVALRCYSTWCWLHNDARLYRGVAQSLACSPRIVFEDLRCTQLR